MKHTITKGWKTEEMELNAHFWVYGCFPHRAPRGTSEGLKESSCLALRDGVLGIGAG